MVGCGCVYVSLLLLFAQSIHWFVNGFVWGMFGNRHDLPWQTWLIRSGLKTSSTHACEIALKMILQWYCINQVVVLTYKNIHQKQCPSPTSCIFMVTFTVNMRLARHVLQRSNDTRGLVGFQQTGTCNITNIILSIAWHVTKRLFQKSTHPQLPHVA